jgi:hypothetical protein
MKNLKTLNTIALLIPICIGLLGFISEGFFMLAAVSTMATGFIQIVVGLFYWIKFPKSIFIKIYFFVVALFFFYYFQELQMIGFGFYQQYFVFIFQ